MTIRLVPDRGEESALTIEQCRVCHGVWFDAAELERYLAEGMTAVDSPPLRPRVRERLDEQEGECPRCARALVREPAPRDAGFSLDRCPGCRRVWLDNAEIDLLEARPEKANGILGRIAALFEG